MNVDRHECRCDSVQPTDAFRSKLASHGRLVTLERHWRERPGADGVVLVARSTHGEQLLYALGLVLIAVPVMIMIDGQISRHTRDAADRETKRQLYVGRARRASQEIIYRPSGQHHAIRPVVPPPADVMRSLTAYEVTLTGRPTPGGI